MLAINARLLPRILRAPATAESDHPAEPHYYLPVAGVKTQWQGRGLGTALMRPVLERCDDGKLPAYLDATSPRNRPLCQRHGFEITEQFSVGPRVAAGMADVADSQRVSLSVHKPPVAAS